jgi:hypothetical protein
MDNNSCIFVVFVCKLCVVLSENHVVLLYVGHVVFGVKYCCQQCIVFGWYNLFVNFYILFDLVGCILVGVCCLRRARALQNGAYAGGAILPRQRAAIWRTRREKNQHRARYRFTARIIGGLARRDIARVLEMLLWVYGPFNSSFVVLFY